ncbi:MAG: hypothetical protein FWG65_08360 [Turicibacter sp.]|nr:hypothetical protein [Turicibacter sp.]
MKQKISIAILAVALLFLYAENLPSAGLLASQTTFQNSVNLNTHQFLVNNAGLLEVYLSQLRLQDAVSWSLHLHDEDCNLDHGLSLGSIFNVNTFYMRSDFAILSIFPTPADIFRTPPPAHTGLTPVQTVRMAASLDCCFNPTLATRIVRELHTISTITRECLRVKVDFMDFCATCYTINITNNSVVRTVSVEVCGVIHE